MPRSVGRIAMGVLLAAGLWSTGCSGSGDRQITCDATEVAPHTQPGAETAAEAFEWFLEQESPGADRDDYELTSSSQNRHVFSDGRHQVSVGVLPSDEDQPPVWVVLVTYDCT